MYPQPNGVNSYAGLGSVQFKDQSIQDRLIPFRISIKAFRIND